MKIFPTRFLGPLLATNRCGTVRARCTTIDSEKSLTSSQLATRAQRNDDVQAFAAARFQKRLQLQLIEKCLRQHRAFDNLLPLHALARVEVEQNAVGVFDRPDRRVPRVKFDHVQLRGLHQCRGAGDFEHRRMTRQE